MLVALKKARRIIAINNVEWCRMAQIVCVRCNEKFRFKAWMPMRLALLILFAITTIYIGSHVGVAASGEAFNGWFVLLIIGLIVAYLLPYRLGVTSCPSCKHIQRL